MPLPPADLQPRLALAIEAAREAGRITLKYFRRDDLDVELKCDDTPVTAADRRAEATPAAADRRGISRRRHLGRGIFRAAGHERLPLDSRSDRRHEVVHPRRAALCDAGGVE